MGVLAPKVPLGTINVTVWSTWILFNGPGLFKITHQLSPTLYMHFSSWSNWKIFISFCSDNSLQCLLQICQEAANKIHVTAWMMGYLVISFANLLNHYLLKQLSSKLRAWRKYRHVLCCNVTQVSFSPNPNCILSPFWNQVHAIFSVCISMSLLVLWASKRTFQTQITIFQSVYIQHL